MRNSDEKNHAAQTLRRDNLASLADAARCDDGALRACGELMADRIRIDSWGFVMTGDRRRDCIDDILAAGRAFHHARAQALRITARFAKVSRTSRGTLEEFPRRSGLAGRKTMATVI
jgi:hypothetical protein